MAAYLIAQIRITDPERYESYKEAVPEVVRRYGGRYLIRGGEVEVLEGRHDGRRLVVFEFPQMEDIRAFFASDEHQEVRTLREGAAVVDAWAVPGV